MPRPFAPSLSRFCLPGALMSFAEIQEAASLNRSITSTYEQINAAYRRTESVLSRGKPRDVQIIRTERESLELA